MGKRKSSLDVLLVLGSGDSLRRAERAKSAYVCLNNLKSADDLNFVLSGGVGKLKKEYRSEAEIMRAYLAESVPNSNLFLEEEALDTVGNFVFSKPIIDNLLSGSISKNVGVVTDPFHMRRSLWLADHVFGAKYSFLPVLTEFSPSISQLVQEYLVFNALKIDFKINKINRGDFDEVSDFMLNTSIYSQNAKASLYSSLFRCYSARA